MTRRRALAPGLVLLALLAASPPVSGAPPQAPDETTEPEGFTPHPEFRPYRDRERLQVEGLTLIRVRRADQSEALVARDAAGWEHVVVEGFRLTFYSQARQALRAVPGRHVVVQDWSGGAHCCFDYHILWIHGIQLRHEGLIRAGDCTLAVADLDRDGSLELLACDSRFAYAFDLPFAESPLVPLVYAFRERAYVADNRPFFRELFPKRIAQERQRLSVAERAADPRRARRAVLSLTLHLLYAGRVTEAWCGFERAYRWSDRDAVRRQIVEGLRRPPDPEDARLPVADLAYTLAPPGPCG